MSMTADIDSPQQDQASNPALDARAAASLNALSEARPTFTADLEEAGRAHTHLAQEWQRETDAQDALTRAEQYASGMIARVDLTGHRFAGFTVGALAVALLLVFGAIPRTGPPALRFGRGDDLAGHGDHVGGVGRGYGRD